ncbi:hypothetical protein Fmac_018571 [Flemingia macrophylla]|uniref:Uncharacterized protein n=1 Tax=Flemingia macrophylla TaxID=520843 RepID=A0ABD1M5C6_9FABA
MEAGRRIVHVFVFVNIKIIIILLKNGLTRWKVWLHIGSSFIYEDNVPKDYYTLSKAPTAEKGLSLFFFFFFISFLFWFHMICHNLKFHLDINTLTS